MLHDHIFDLMDLFSDKEIDSFVIQDGDFRLQLKKDSFPIKRKDSTQVKGKKAMDDELGGEEILTEEVSEKEEIFEERISIIQEGLEKVHSKYVGFYHVSTPTAQESQGYGEVLGVGSEVVEGQTLCFISVLEENKEIISPVNGILRQINFAEGSFVQYSDLLFVIEKRRDNHV